VNGFLIVPLVLALSGVPAAAVVCDLVLCPDPAKAAAASTGCHDHALPQSGERMAPSEGDCTHISAVDPYVASGSRVVFQPVASAPVASMSDVPVTSLHSVEVRSARGSPNSPPAASSLPLRI
jgi:hypothetical protein